MEENTKLKDISGDPETGILHSATRSLVLAVMQLFSPDTSVFLRLASLSPVALPPLHRSPNKMH